MSLLTLFLEDDDDMAIPVVTWATLPAASSSTGKRYRVSDVGPNGSDWISKGTAWEPVQGIVTIARSAVAASVTGTLSEAALATITIKPAMMGSNGQLRITVLFSNNNNANAKNARVRFGGISGTVYLDASNTTNISLQWIVQVRNRNAANSQIGFVSTAAFGNSAAANVTGAIDTSSSQDLVITGQLANTGDTLTLESYSVELIR